jgi:hypothetical protein
MPDIPMRTIELQPGLWVVEVSHDATGHWYWRVEKDETIWPGVPVPGLREAVEAAHQADESDDWMDDE